MRASTDPRPFGRSKLAKLLPVVLAGCLLLASICHATQVESHANASQAGLREPSEQEINEARKIIHEIAATIKTESASKLTTSRPILSQAHDFAPDSPAAKVAEAATQFGLNFVKSLPSSEQENVVVSPVSLQILLNMILLGSKNQSETQQELSRVLGYETANSQELASKDQTNATTLSAEDTTQLSGSKPHEAMHSLLESIALTIHAGNAEPQLLNSNAQITSHLQTAVAPPDSQVNFTLASLMLTNRDLVRTSLDYERNLAKYYVVKLEHFDRRSNGTETRPLHERVNSWVQNATHNQIVNLVDGSDLADSDLAAVLLNAAHFKARWLHTFSGKLTHERIFYNNGQVEGAQETKFMRQNGVFGYGEFEAGAGGQLGSAGEQASNSHQSGASGETVLTEDPTTTTKAPNEAVTDERGPGEAGLPTIELSREEAHRFELTSKLNCSVLMLPFALNEGQELSMVIILPHQRDGLPDLLANLNGPALIEVYRSLNEQQVQVELPKFSFESTHDAKSTLGRMGLKRIFQRGAELEEMFSEDSANRQLARVDKLVHKARVTVDEMGAEAAAASAATIVLRNLVRPANPSFVADHPFLFVIRHNRSNLPLFIGRVERL